MSYKTKSVFQVWILFRISEVSWRLIAWGGEDIASDNRQNAGITGLDNY